MCIHILKTKREILQKQLLKNTEKPLIYLDNFPAPTSRLIGWHGRILQFSWICNTATKTGKIQLLCTLSYKEYFMSSIPGSAFIFPVRRAFPQSCTWIAKNKISYMQEKTTGHTKTEYIFTGISRCFLYVLCIPLCQHSPTVLHLISSLFYLKNIINSSFILWVFKINI